MIRARKVEEIDKSLVERFSNEQLVIEASRKSRLTRKDKSAIMKVAFSNSHKYYSTDELAHLLRKSVYQMNFDSYLQYQLFCGLNSMLVELRNMSNKSDRLKETEQFLGNLFELMFFIGQSDADEFLHDELKGGWYHPEAILDDYEKELRNHK